MENSGAEQVLTNQSIDETLVKLKNDFFAEIENIFIELQKSCPLSIEELQLKKEEREIILRELKEARDSIKKVDASQTNGTNKLN